MAKEEISFNEFLTAVDPSYQSFIHDLHNYLLDNSYKAAIQLKSSGYFISYTHAKTKKSLVNLLFRKKGLITRIYGENSRNYEDFLNTLPQHMTKPIEKASVCKRLIDPTTCNPKCTMGYAFKINETSFQKCKNSCFMFDVDNDNNPVIKAFIEHEMKERDTV